MNAPQRPLSVSDALGLIKGFSFAKAQQIYATLYLGLPGLSASFAKKPDKEKAYITKRFAKLMARGSFDQRLLACVVLHEISGGYWPLPKISKLLCGQTGDLTQMYHSWHSFMALPFDRAHRFNPWQLQKLDRHIRRVYAHLFDQAKAQLQPELPQNYVSKPDRVVLTLGQFLGRRHAPTATTLLMADTLTAMGKEVMIYNLSHVPRRSASAFYSPMVAPLMEKLSEIDALTLANGSTARFKQNTHLDMTHAAFEEFWNHITDFSPETIISVGPGNLYADIAGQTIPHVAMPSTLNISIGTPGAYGIIRDITDLELRLLAPLGVSRENLVRLPSAFSLPDTQGPQPREQFGVTPGDYAVAVVTNRADKELTDDFLCSLEACLAASPQLQVRFFGRIDSTICAPILERISQHPRMRAEGFQSDLFGALAGFDALLNPPRMGGGTSAAYALALGLNVFTIGGGDVAQVTGPDFVSNTPDEMFAALSAAAQDASDVKAKATARWDEISDMEAQIRPLLAGARRAAVL